MKTRILLIWILLLGTVGGYAQNVETFVRHQLSEYPKSRLLDIYKSCFQDYMGPEHIVKDTAQVRRYMDYELSHFSLSSSKRPYYEPCGLKGRYVRVSLQVVKENKVSKDLLMDAFIRSANSKKRPSVASWKKKWQKIQIKIDALHLDLPAYQSDKQYIDSVLQKGKYATSHSVDYGEAYHPHYCIIERSIFEREILPLLPNSVTTK